MCPQSHLIIGHVFVECSFDPVSSYLLTACCHTDATGWNQTKPVRDSALGWTVWPSERSDSKHRRDAESSSKIVETSEKLQGKASTCWKILERTSRVRKKWVSSSQDGWDSFERQEKHILKTKDGEREINHGSCSLDVQAASRETRHAECQKRNSFVTLERSCQKKMYDYSLNLAARYSRCNGSK